MILKQSKADPGQAHRARAPLFENFWVFVFENFDRITRIFFNCSQHTMFTICFSISTLATKTYNVCEGASKQSPDPKNFTAPGPRPPVLKFLDPPLTIIVNRQVMKFLLLYDWYIADTGSINQSINQSISCLCTCCDLKPFKLKGTFWSNFFKGLFIFESFC